MLVRCSFACRSLDGRFNAVILAVAIKAPLSMVDDPREAVDSAIRRAPGPTERFPGAPLTAEEPVDTSNAASPPIRSRSLPPR
jgi:hypothetical protein